VATWDELFKNKQHILEFPQTEVIKFIKRLENDFTSRPLAVWDQCCGGGRHSILIAQMGHYAYGSDISPTGVEHLQKRVKEIGLPCQTAIADMTQKPWKDGQQFHGIICWDALHHNTIDRIYAAVNVLKQCLIENGLLLATLISTKSGGNEKGREIEKNTFISDEGLEAGVPHHYFDYSEIKSLFKGWEVCILAEVVATYVETETEFYKQNPFPYTKWNLLMKKAP
jgi:2-polyprenyl-3-methyl-5-hydroxy-6-metoxy-1,4-benzoquinol methylase